MRSGVGSLDGELSGLLGPGWSGEAASAYDAVWREWHQGAQQVVEGLARMSTLLNDAAQHYDATDATAGRARIRGWLTSTFHVDPAALLAVVDRMSEFDSALEAHLARVSGSVAALGTSWYGDAGEAERSAQQRWDQGAAEMRDALARLRQIAEVAHENYSGAAQVNVHNWR